tara:strand:+ start:61 stop:402 length:342 start_codon:yes stop_codon:yes gene_type:complete
MDLSPDFGKMKDIELLGLVAYCEKWKPEKVYNIAHAEVFPEHQLKEARMPFDRWFEKTDQTLPLIVRQELIRAAEINLKAGRMSKLEAAYMSTSIFRNWYFWFFILSIIWWWL